MYLYFQYIYIHSITVKSRCEAEICNKREALTESIEGPLDRVDGVRSLEFLFDNFFGHCEFNSIPRIKDVPAAKCKYDTHYCDPAADMHCNIGCQYPFLPVA